VRADRAPDRLTAVFLDRDGVINRKAVEGDYVTSWEQFVFLPDALEGLRILAASPLSIAVVSNQRGVALGRMTAEQVDDINDRMQAAVADAGGRIDVIRYCPHDRGCRCRKPEVGMFEDAASELQIWLSETAVVGDRASDMLAAERIGALRVLVGAEEYDGADYRATGLADAARWLVGRPAIAK
jgi:D-glycero-D-manno-heptose 1,7-bisphosphate phosphatase